MRLLAFSAALLLSILQPAFGQHTLTGTLTNTRGEPIADAEVYLKEPQALENTSARGTFRFENLEAGTYTLVAFAYEYKVLERVVAISADTGLELTLEDLGLDLPEVVVRREREKVFALKKLKTVEGTAIFAGKKSEVILVENLVGNLAANNPRQIYNQVVGLNIFDYGDAGLQLNIGGRGLDPNRTANFNVRQNGYDISADALGYPESYYTPPAEALGQIQVVRGAASLQYGPQFGGLVNFRFKTPNPGRKIEWISRQTLGSFDLKTSFNSLSGTLGKFSYYTYFNYKEGNGFRPNSQFNSRNYHGHFGYRLGPDTRISLEVSLLDYLAKQPGGLTDAQFLQDPEFSNRDRNWFDVSWNLFALQLEHRLSERTDLSLNLFALDASRSALGFRTNRVSQPDDPEAPRELLVDEFLNWGAEGRVLTRYNLGERKAVLLLGSKYYQTSNTQQQGPGSAAADPDFTFATATYPNYERQSNFEFPNLNVALFGENVFPLSDRFTLTPGFRFEYIKTQSEGAYRNIVLDLAGNPLLNEEVPDNRVFERSFLLLGLGASYQVTPALEGYANLSQNYRSVTFNDIRVVNPTYQVDPNISDENGFTADAGIRGSVGEALRYDLSLFGMLYDNRLGEILRSETRTDASGQEVETGRVVRFRGNIGTALILGAEAFGEWNLQPSLWPQDPQRRLNLFANLALTDSRYTRSEETNVEGNQVEFVPVVNLKSGLRFGYRNLLGSLQYTFLSEQFTDATNAPRDPQDNQRGIEGTIPAYDILDLSLSYTLGKFTLEGGLNNLLDRSYFTRRATGYPGPGIIPAEPRTYYLTLGWKL
ncbi:TonB-dependent receptor [Robiginitalea sp. M366]|uniref:TonB-dependent receptor domain-containing protein n=1 Tax=Robiginitalea aestuariiviva TaxID=3036903 RepID=UPI00240E5B0D|nr:TonB-dependent receptor [Robiginitalea aestuariiviva]MDG1572343.1 TonB-dependent receptor [Robiginitalea aestuariiviva]